ncbi:hypothetical protein ACROYT_G026137 [Oculina patagonica]
MPPKRSARLAASTANLPAAKKQKRGRQPSAMTSGTRAAHSESEATQESPVSNSLLPPELIDQLVTRVADTVSRRMAGNSDVVPTVDALAEVPFTDPSTTGSSLVQSSIAAVQKNLTGETITPRQSIPDQLFVSSSLPLDAFVSDKIRAKIWNEEYIDFGTLITNPELVNKYSVTVGNAESGSMPSLCLEPVSKPKTITTIEAWSSCFLIFIGVYTSRYPAETPALMKYGEKVSSTATNLVSASLHPKVVDDKIKKELDFHRLAGPFQFPPLNPFRIPPLGVVPKKTPDEFRLIHHLSYPKGSSVNNGIDSEHTRVCYATVDDAIKFIKLAGPGCFLAKTGIKNAFRIIPISPDDYNLLGMQWRGLYYYDRCMPMECSSSCLTFEIFSSAVEWIARMKFNIGHILHLLDDFLIVASSATLCQDQLALFLSLCSYLGIPMAPEKTCGPATTL